MRIGVLRETADAERRVAATPETVKKLIALGASVAVEAGAGAGANIADAAFADAGASVGDRAATVAGSDLILAVQTPDAADLPGITAGAMLAGIVAPFANRPRTDGYAAAGITAMAMELMPRITRAQSMDVLSVAVEPGGLQGGDRRGRSLWPRLPDDDDGRRHDQRRARLRHGRRRRRAAGDRHRPAPGGAGQRHRRPRRDQGADRILGAKAIFVDSVKGIEGEGTGGYATEMSDEYKAAQAALVSATSPSRTSSSPPR